MGDKLGEVGPAAIFESQPLPGDEQFRRSSFSQPSQRLTPTHKSELAGAKQAPAGRHPCDAGVSLPANYGVIVKFTLAELCPPWFM